MAKIKTDTLIGNQLNFAVAICVGGSIRIMTGVFLNQGDGYEYFTPTDDWSQGGPIIERECIDLKTPRPNWKKWQAQIPKWADGVGMYETTTLYGPTPLIAAMRCYVASKMGDEIDIPKELL